MRKQASVIVAKGDILGKGIAMFVGLFSVVAFILTINQYHGDSVIYLCFAKNWFRGMPFQFNAGEFSSGATSPLWSAMLSICFFFSKPWIAFKAVSFVTFAVALVVSAWTFRNAITLWLYAFMLTAPALMGYETGLLVVGVTLLIRWTWITPSNLIWIVWTLLPFVRPEAVLFVLASIIYRRNIVGAITLLPICLYWTASYHFTGYFCTSAVFRSEYAIRNIGSVIQRYGIILFPFIVWRLSIILKSIKLERFDYAFLITFMFAISLNRINGKQGYTWEQVTNKANAERLEGSGYVIAWEVQDRYYIPDSLIVISECGIIDGKIGRGIDFVLKQYKPRYIQRSLDSSAGKYWLRDYTRQP